MQDTHIETIKTCVKIVVGTSVTYVTATVIRTYCPHTNKVQKTKVLVSSYVLGAMLADKAAEYVERQIENIVKTVRELRAKNTAQ